MHRSPAVITVPHALCSSHEAVIAHACDTVAPHAARGLAWHLGRQGRHVAHFTGNTDRRQLDLNRKVAHRSEFVQQADRALAAVGPWSIYLDVHSWPGDRLGNDRYLSHWVDYDLVVCAWPFNRHCADHLASQLRGWKVLIDTPARTPLLNHYAMIQRLGPRAGYSLMLEFDEDTGLTTLDALVSAVAAAIAQVP